FAMAPGDVVNPDARDTKPGHRQQSGSAPRLNDCAEALAMQHDVVTPDDDGGIDLVHADLEADATAGVRERVNCGLDALAWLNDEGAAADRRCRPGPAVLDDNRTAAGG